MKIAQPKIGMTVVLLMYCQTNGILSSISGIQKKGKIWLDPPYSRPIMPLSMVVDFIYTGCALDGSRGQVLLHIQFTIMPLSCYGVFRFIMERGDKGCEVIVSGKLRAQRAKSIKFKDRYMISSGQKEPCFMFVYF